MVVLTAARHLAAAMVVLTAVRTVVPVIAARTVVLTAVPRLVRVMAARTQVPTAAPKDLPTVVPIRARPMVEPTAVRGGAPDIGYLAAGDRAATGRAPGSPAVRRG
ncbi:hypothetical protein GCM10009744_01490 [Kribbella alba]|uniref:Secreted protein n=1 Tax=Kribbella alba TaxID=190197 RepID=A0ABP4QRI0_9ACTN